MLQVLLWSIVQNSKTEIFDSKQSFLYAFEYCKFASLIKKLIYSKKITKKIIIFEVLLVEKYQRFDQRFFY